VQPTTQQETRLIGALRAGDEAAFASLIDMYHASMLRIAMLYVRNASVAEEVVQDAWLGMLRGLGGFEARSSLKTWLFRILVNTAKARAMRERRSVPLSVLADAGLEVSSFEPALEPERFRPPDAPQWAGGWVSFPMTWGDAPEERLLARETQLTIRGAIDALPPNQRSVVSLRDIEGWAAEEVCQVLQITEANQRVLLHRGRSRVRRVLERYLTGT
jgi:RNA polymerase sigma-70 factor (ECF subfamily)